METALTEVVTLAFKLLITAALPVILWGIHKAIKGIETKTKVDVPAAIESKIDSWVEEAVYFAEEKSLQKIKAKTEKLSGPEKLETAAGFVMSLIESQGYVDWTKDLIKNKIEAKLNKTRE